MLNNWCILPRLWAGLKIENLPSKIGLILWLIIFVLAFAWRAQNLAAFGLSNDEGAYLMWSQLAVEGYPLYQETRAVQPPLFFEWIGLAFRLAGYTITAGRWAVLVGFGLLAVALSGLAHRAGGWLAALAALVLLGLAPLIFTFSRLVMAETPATALAVLSVALLFVFMARERKIWLVASGLALGLSLLVKPLNPFVVGPVGVLLWVHSGVLDGAVHPAGSRGNALRQRLASLLLNGLVWGVSLLMPLVIVLFFYDPVAMFDQLIVFRGDLRAAIPGSWSETWAQFALLVHSHWGFWLLAAGGIVSAAWCVYEDEKQRGAQPISSNGERISQPPNLPISPTLYVLIWVMWLIAGIVMLAWHTPLFPQHLVVLLPPLILLGAGFIADTGALWRNALRCHSQTGGLAAAYGRVTVFTLIIIIAAFNLPSIIEANQHTVAIVTGGRETRAIELLQAVSNPNDFVMGDSQLLIFMAGRRTPPPLGDVALVAVKAGRQTAERMITLTQTYQAPAVAQWSLRLPWLPEYLDWVEANYLARRVWDNDHIIYFAPRFPNNHPLPNERSIRLGESVILRGSEVNEASVRSGQDLSVKVYWQTDAPLTRDYTVFTQLLDSQGALVTSWDSQPLGGYFPTSQWPVGEIVTDRVHLPVPSDLPAGDYTLITGLYTLETLERLLTPQGVDHVVLTTVTLSEHSQ